MRITREFIFEGISDGGSWTYHQLELLKVERPPREGWIDKIIGREISDEDARDFLRLKNSSNAMKRRAAERGAKKTPTMF